MDGFPPRGRGIPQPKMAEHSHRGGGIIATALLARLEPPAVAPQPFATIVGLAAIDLRRPSEFGPIFMD